ncbi:MAG TPA: YbaK/EbsC family protein [Solirubrobacterales bacterium]|jgi:prolyl-tRNA editing enzyme YbaK/EbsC (Cys-tRNA(Pro) deacylase)|nr:YbaK/EbsC family protein [Solirubrobacterales bacterium]
MDEAKARADLPDPVRRVAAALEAAGQPTDIRLLDQRTHTVEEAAGALDIDPRQIVKSMVFRGERDGRLVLVVLAGDRQVDLGKVSALLGEPVKRADPDWVRERTGFDVGGIPPLAHATPATIVVDAGIDGDEDLWAGAGTSRAMFRTSGRGLREATGGTVADVAR